MAKCNNCGSPDADIDWGLCYECFCSENEKGGGHLSGIAAINYNPMGMANEAEICRNHAKKLQAIKKITNFLDNHPDSIPQVLNFLKL